MVISNSTKTILIVDDEQDTVKLLSIRLAKNGYAVIPCYTGSEALSAVQNKIPDLAILDIRLPDTDGYELLKTFRQNDALAHMPVIFSTADANVAVRKTIKEHDADDCVIKPYDAHELLKKIENLLAA